MIELFLLILFVGVLVIVAMHSEHTHNKEYHAGCYEDECLNDYHQIISQKQAEINRIPIVPSVVE